MRRARCFESGESIELAYACNLCLSIFKEEPRKGSRCPTCEAVYQVEDGNKNKDSDLMKSRMDS